MFNIINYYLKNYENIKSIKYHNNKIFKNNKIFGETTKISLIEFNSNPTNHIANSYFSNYFSTEHKIKVVAYDLNYSNKVLSNLFFYLKKIFNVGDFGIYRSFGTNDFFKIKLKKNHVYKSDQYLNSFFKQIKSKNQFLKLKINNVLLGDLIYDTYLKVNNEFTIKLDDPKFKSFVKKMITVFFFWEDYFKIHKVVSINVSHTIYQNAIPLRIAIRNKIPAYQLNFSHAFYLTNNNFFAYKDFIYYKNEFKKIPVDIKKRGKLLAKKKLDLRLKGRVGVDMVYSTKSAFHQNLVKSNIKKSSKFKILIAAHCFYDNPHPYGNNVFPDIYEWINFLGKFSEKTNYDWYIKSHTDFIPETRDKLLSITKKHKKFNLLPHDISHHQIKAEGIDVALTCWGTIGFEYALLGIPVINASQNNPHINYNFNIHAKTLKEYEKILLNIKNIKLKMNKNEIYEFYFMKNIFYSTNLFVKDFDNFVRNIGGYNSLFNSSFYNSWINEWSKEKHLDLIKLFKEFFKSRKYRLKI